jgi:hypothetical protein
MNTRTTRPTLRFFTERRLVELTGLRARNLKELYTVLRSVSGSSIFYHTHEVFLQHHFAAPSFRNDFAAWVTESLQEIYLGEELAGIDIRDFMSIRALRMRILAILKTHLQNYPDLRQTAPEDAFHFCKAKSFLMPTHLEATDLASFVEAMHQVTKSSLFYHFFAARFRLRRRTNDFSHWLEAIGEKKTAAAIDRLDPYFLDLEEVRKRTLAIAEAALAAGAGS